MPVNCRIARAEDLPSLCALGAEVSRFHHAALPNVFARPDDPERDATIWAQAIEEPDSVAIVAERGTQVVGVATATLADEDASVFQARRYCCLGVMGVVPAERGRGVGRALMAAVEQWAREHAAAEVHLDVWSFNETAIRLYAELGYAPRTQRMVKPLDSLHRKAIRP
jgi:GNAT superfamily N-acetyltransferase